MPITDIEEFFKFYDDMSDEEINAIFDKFKPEESSTETVYAEDFLKFLEISKKEIDNALRYLKPNNIEYEPIYAEDYIKLMKATNRVETISIDLAFLVLKSNNQIFSTVQIRSIYDVVGFDNPLDYTYIFKKEYLDYKEHYSKDCEIRHFPQETEYFQIIYKTVDIDVNPF
jgi:hypothetical protein